MIAALFVDPAGPYVGLTGVDPWDEERDARLYAGPWSVVAHPPCERWGRMAEGSPTHKRFKVGDDGGCFKAALAAVRRVGGVIEHPQGSHAWRHFDLPIPEGRGWTPADRFGGRSCYIDQGAYGHSAKKPTWLYAVLPTFPKMNWTRVWGRPYIGGDGFHSSAERARAKATGRLQAEGADPDRREPPYAPGVPGRPAGLGGFRPHLPERGPMGHLEAEGAPGPGFHHGSAMHQGAESMTAQEAVLREFLRQTMSKPNSLMAERLLDDLLRTKKGAP